MKSQITNGVKISVETLYQAVYSNPLVDHYVFSYDITIENLKTSVIRLMRRHWFIEDSIGESYEVEGEGVIGMTPVIYPGKSHSYQSGCNFKSTSGKMSGSYLMIDLDNELEFSVKIPEFVMAVPEIFLK